MAFNNYYGNGMGGYNPPPYYNNSGAMPDQLGQYRAQQYQQLPAQQYGVQQNAAQSPMAQTLSSNGIIWVQGEEGAKAYLVAPGNSVVLWDSENPVIYLKTADNSGMPSMRIFDLNERMPFAKDPPQSVSAVSNVDYITREEFTALENRLNSFLEKENAAKHTEAKPSNKSKEDKSNG